MNRRDFFKRAAVGGTAVAVGVNIAPEVAVAEPAPKATAIVADESSPSVQWVDLHNQVMAKMKASGLME